MTEAFDRIMARLNDPAYIARLEQERAREAELQEFLMTGTLTGKQLDEIVIACQIEILQIDCLIKAKRKLDDFDDRFYPKLRNCFEAVIKYVRSHDRVSLDGLHGDALKYDEIESIGVIMASSSDNADTLEKKLTEDSPAPGQSLQGFIDNSHFIMAGHFLAYVFMELKAIEHGKTEELIPILERERFRGAPTFMVNVPQWAPAYARTLFDYQQLSTRKSSRQGIAGELAAICYRDLIQCFTSEREAPPGVQELSHLVREATAGAAAEKGLPIKLGTGRSG